MAEWLKAADCKSARVSVRWFESSPVHHPSPSDQGSSTPSSATSARMRRGAGALQRCDRSYFNAQAGVRQDFGQGPHRTYATVGWGARALLVRAIGVEWARKFGDTARFARAAGEDASGASFVMGIKAWF